MADTETAIRSSTKPFSSEEMAVAYKALSIIHTLDIVRTMTNWFPLKDGAVIFDGLSSKRKMITREELIRSQHANAGSEDYRIKPEEFDQLIGLVEHVIKLDITKREDGTTIRYYALVI